jgi:hypothetical protein
MPPTMAREKKKSPRKGRPAGPNPRNRVVSFRCTEDFYQWIAGLSDHTRISPSTMLELGLIKWACEEAKYDEPPPRR